MGRADDQRRWKVGLRHRGSANSAMCPPILALTLMRSCKAAYLYLPLRTAKTLGGADADMLTTSEWVLEPQSQM